MVLALSLAGEADARAQTADEKLNAFFRQYLEDLFRLRPFEATRLGDHRFDALIENLTPQSRAVWQDQTRKAATDLPRMVDYPRLSRPAQIDYEILEHHLNYELWLMDNTHPYEEDPRIYNDYINDSVHLLLTQSTLPPETNVANAIARMALIPKVLAAARAKPSQPAPGPSPKPPSAKTVAPSSSTSREIYNHAASKTRQLAALKSAAATVVSELKDYQKFLENDLLPRANGEWRLGPEKFARKLELELDAGMTADQVLGDAEAELARVQDQMYVIARQLWSKYYFKQSLPPDDENGRRTTVQLVLDAIAAGNAARPETLARDMRERVARLKRFIVTSDFVELPVPDRTKVIADARIPPRRFPRLHGSRAAARHQCGGSSGDQPAARGLGRAEGEQFPLKRNTTTTCWMCWRFMKAIPVTQCQLAYASQNSSLIRRVLPSGAYVEGWAVYAEKTMLDQGYCGGDLALRVSQLKFYLRTVANAVLDHKMQCGTMTDDQALAFLTRQCFESESEAQLRISSAAKQSSCQLWSVFLRAAWRITGCGNGRSNGKWAAGFH